MGILSRSQRLVLLLWLAALPADRPAFSQDAEARVRRGVSLLNSARAAEAELEFRSILDEDPDQRDARLLLGYLLLQRAALDEAQEAFTRVLAEDPGNAPARLGLGVIWTRKGHPEKAARELRTILNIRNFEGKAGAEYLFSLFVMGRDEEAYREARELTLRHPDVADYHQLRALFAQLRGNLEEAIKEYENSLTLDPVRVSTYLTLISLLRERKEYDHALRWTRAALQVDGNHPLLFEEMARLYRLSGHVKEADAAQAEAVGTLAAERLFLRAGQVRRAGNVRDAERLLRECLQRNPRLSKAWLALGGILREDNRLREAESAFVSALETDPDNTTAHVELAALFRSQGKTEEAARAYRGALRRGLQGPDLYSGLAATYLNQGLALDAAAQMLQAVRVAPDDPDLLSYLGFVQQAGGQTEAAVHTFDAALYLDPHNPEAQLGRALAALERGLLAEAQEELAKVLRSHPASVEGWHGLIQARRRAGDDAGALQAAAGCIEKLPGDEECREQMAYLLLERFEYREAATQFRHLVGNGTVSKNILDGFAFSLLHTGAFEEAQALFQRSLKRYGPDALLYANLGFVFRSRGDLKSAIDSYRQACRLAPQDAARNFDLGLALYLAGEYASAVGPLQAALRLRPGWGEAHLNLAMTFWNLREHALALAHAREALDHGVEAAGPIVRSLSQSLALLPMQSISVYRPKK